MISIFKSNRTQRKIKFLPVLLIGLWLVACDVKIQESENASTTPVTNLQGNKDTSDKDKDKNKTKDTPGVDANDDLLFSVKLPKTLEDALAESKDKTNPVSELVNQIKQKKPISFSTITQLFVKKHLRMHDAIKSKLNISESTPSFADFSKTLSTVESKISEKKDLHVLKTQLESGLGDIKTYNRDYITIPNVVIQKKLQCYSGTSTFEVISRDVLKAKSFSDQHMVIIMVNGHITPGYFTKVNDEWNLFGIETTNRGKAKVSYGKIKEAKSPMRILDANLWMMMEVLIPYQLAAQKTGAPKVDGKKIMREALDITNEMYDGQIPVDALEKAIDQLQTTLKANGTFTETADSEFGGVVSEGVSAGEPVFGSFGEAKVEAGDIEMKEVDELSPDSGGESVEKESRLTSKTGPIFKSVSSTEKSNENLVQAVPPPQVAAPKMLAAAPEKVSQDVLGKFYQTSMGIVENKYVMQPSELDQDCKANFGAMSGEWSLMMLKQNGYNLKDCKLDFTNPFPDGGGFIKTTRCEIQSGKLNCKDLFEYRGGVDGEFEFLGSTGNLCILKIQTQRKSEGYDTDYLIGIPAKSNSDTETAALFFAKLSGKNAGLCQLGQSRFSR